jgi:uroporphyrinogen decarboxylase
MNNTTETPDFENRLRKVLLCEGLPDRVPLVEAGIYTAAKERFLGHPIQSLRDEITFWSRAGYDTFQVTSGLREIVDAAIHHGETGQYESAANESGGVRAAKEYAIHKLHPHALTSELKDGTRHWAPTHEGIIITEKDFDDFPWPRPEEIDYSVFEEAASAMPPGMKVIPFAGAIISSVSLMMGMQNFFTQLALGEPLVEKMFQKVGEFQLAVVDILLGFDTVGAIWINDDMGSSTSTLVNPKHLRQHLFPWYERIAGRTHAANRPLMLHSDGCLYPILEDLVQIGFNAIHPIEPKAMDIHRVREIVGPNVCLIGNVNLGFPLGTGTPADVEASVRELIRAMAPNGSYCISSANSIPEYIPYENWLALRNASLRYGRYPIDVGSLEGV